MAPKKAALTGDEKEVVLNYLNRMNRPYNAGDLFLNLNSAIPKTLLGKLLTELAVEDLIMSKPYGKQVIFCAKQNSQLASPEEIQNLDAQIAKLTESAAVATEKLKVDERVYAKLAASQRTNELPLAIEAYETKINAMKERLANIESKGGQMSDSDRTKIDKEYDAMRSEWRKRRKMFTNVWNMITESYQGKAADLKEELGIEDDNDAGVNIDAALVKEM